MNCEHVNTEQCRARPGEAASVYNCVEQETLISAGGGKNCQRKCSPILALIDINIHNIYILVTVYTSDTISTIGHLNLVAPPEIGILVSLHLSIDHENSINEYLCRQSSKFQLKKLQPCLCL